MSKKVFCMALEPVMDANDGRMRVLLHFRPWVVLR